MGSLHLLAYIYRLARAMQKSACLVVDSRLETLNHLQTWFEHWYYSLGPEFSWVQCNSDRLNIAVAEGFTNAVRHAHAHLPLETPIKIEVQLVGDRLAFIFGTMVSPLTPINYRNQNPVACSVMVATAGFSLGGLLTASRIGGKASKTVSKSHNIGISLAPSDNPTQKVGIILAAFI
jgi:hypothetical protein